MVLEDLAGARPQLFFEFFHGGFTRSLERNLDFFFEQLCRARALASDGPLRNSLMSWGRRPNLHSSASSPVITAAAVHEAPLRARRASVGVGRLPTELLAGGGGAGEQDVFAGWS